MKLDKYWKKRHFGVTPEPEGVTDLRGDRHERLIFVVQKHRASHVRRREKAPISMPLDWSEVKPALDPSNFNLGNFHKRLGSADPWKNFFRSRQSIKEAMAALRKL
jgi:hypothetical protein